MSSGSGFSRRWRKIRQLPGRVPLRIKLITAVLALVAIALSITSIAGISVLRGYLLGTTDRALQNADFYDNFVRHYLFTQNAQGALGGQIWIAYVPEGGNQFHPVLEPVMGRPGSLNVVPPPTIPTSARWLAEHNGVPVTVPGQSGGRQWRVIAYRATFLTDQGPVSGTVLAAIDVTTIYRTVAALAIIDLIVSGIVLVALAIVGIAIV